jgi:hypothetical protein
VEQGALEILYGIALATNNSDDFRKIATPVQAQISNRLIKQYLQSYIKKLS